MDLIKMVLLASDEIRNGRDSAYALRYGLGEFDELVLEFEKREAGEAAGPDGIIGEAIDVIQCLIDLIRLEYPDLSHDELLNKMMQTMASKCVKWRKKYSTAETINAAAEHV